MSDDEPSRAEQRLIDHARKQQAKQQLQQPQPPGKVTIKRTARFHGNEPRNAYWLSQAWSPDGTQLAYGGKTAKSDGVLDVWDGNSGHHEPFKMRHLTHDLAGMVISMAWSPDSKHLATVEEDHKSLAKAVHIRSQAEGPRPVQFPQKLPVTQVTWSPDGSTLALSGPDCPQTVLIDASTGAQKRVLDNLSGPVAWRPDGRAIAGLYETSVLLVDPATGGRTGRLADHEHRPTAVAWARHGGRLAVADGEKIRVWNADTSEVEWRIPWTTVEGDRGPDPAISSLQWLDGGRYLLEFRPRGGAWHDELGSTCSTLILWDVQDRALFVELFSEVIFKNRLPAAGVALAPDGRRCAVAFDDRLPAIWTIDGDLPNLIP
ncbi:MAG TPA: WD40 repeat domain-containing protein [Trebonia sp.]|nr:WD40 repeat domain-containing protein [Trebonia sp.]